jgi:PhnB protein
MQLNPYLTFDGRCEDAFKFYAKVLGGEIVAMIRHEGTPAETHVPTEWRKKIMHARLIVDGEVLMGSDAPPDRSDGAMKGFSVTLSIDRPAEADRVFAALADKGTVRMPIQETFWARRFGMLTDQFGTPWMINCEKKPA